MKLCTAFFALFITALSLNAQVQTGIEVLRDRNFDILRGKRVGLITNTTGIDRSLKSTIDILHEADGVNLVALFSPEHGIRGDVYAGATVDKTKDKRTGLQVFSIYGATKKPTQDMLRGIDALVYDIQDIGCRSYTFISTMGLAMEAASETGIEFIVLDRPNPLGGLKIEGNITEADCVSFVSQFKIPYIYGLTCGELALLLNGEGMLKGKCKLTIVEMTGWKRSMTWEDTGLPWVMTSPHIPTSQTSQFYPMTGILGELGYVNIGVGYTLPFQMVGAPWIDADNLADRLNQKRLSGLSFRPVHYKPFYSTFKGELCHGVQIYITDYSVANISEVQFIIMQTLNELHPERATFVNADRKRFDMFDKVCGSTQIRKLFSKEHNWTAARQYWEKDNADFEKIARKYWIY